MQPRWPLNAGAYAYRPLKRGIHGWDTYALQTGLIALGYDLGPSGADGWFGDKTNSAVRLYQRQRSLTVDGIAGIVTQTHIGMELASVARNSANLPLGLPHGQIQHECGWQLGNYTPVYPDTGKRDLGPTQQNLVPNDENCIKAFDVPRAIARLAADPERGLRARKDRYRKFVRVGNDRRAWELAVGSWNAPSVADAYAANRRSTLPQYLIDYIQTCTKYVTEWTP